MKDFKFEYSGEIHPGKNQKDVIKNLARIFSVTEFEVEPFFSGNHIFIRNGIDEFTANAYLQTFKKCGALGRVSLNATAKENVNKQLSPPSHNYENNCPKCGSTNINKEQCLDCGIYIEKYIQRLQVNNDSNSHVETLDAEDVEDQKYRYKATKWLIGASSLLTVVGIIDSFFQEHLVLGIGRLDLGYIPYILAHLVLLRGCFLYAASKGYDSLYGLLGVLSFAGLSILLLLPDKDERYNVSSGKQKIFAGLCIGVCIYWLMQFLNTSSDIDHFYTQADLLAAGRSEYPNNTLNSENAIYKREHEELVAFIKASLTEIQEGKYRSSQALEISGRIFQEVARYSIWRNYQKYLHTINQADFPESLVFKNQKKLNKEISLLFKPLFGSDEPVGEAYMLWSSGMSMFGSSNTFWDEFRKYQMLIWEQYRIYAFESREKLGEKALITLKDFKLPKNKKIITSMDDYTITFSAPEGPLAKTPVTMALYMSSYTYSGQRRKAFYVDIISHELPHRHIQSPFNEVEKYTDF